MQNLRNMSVIALSVNQEINKSETLSHGISEVTILQNSKLSKLEVHHMASLDLLILQKLEIQQNWNFTMCMYICCFTKTGNQQN